MNTEQRRFCAGVVRGLCGTEAYLAAYPGANRATAGRQAKRLLKRGDVQAEIARLRAMADAIGGEAVLSLVERRKFLARVVRARGALLPEDSDLWLWWENMETGVVRRMLPNKLRAVFLDSKLAGEGFGRKRGQGKGSQEMSDADRSLRELLERIRGKSVEQSKGREEVVSGGAMEAGSERGAGDEVEARVEASPGHLTHEYPSHG